MIRVCLFSGMVHRGKSRRLYSEENKNRKMGRLCHLLHPTVRECIHTPAQRTSCLSTPFGGSMSICRGVSVGGRWIAGTSGAAGAEAEAVEAVASRTWTSTMGSGHQTVPRMPTWVILIPCRLREDSLASHGSQSPNIPEAPSWLMNLEG